MGGRKQPPLAPILVTSLWHCGGSLCFPLPSPSPPSLLSHDKGTPDVPPSPVHVNLCLPPSIFPPALTYNSLHSECTFQGHLRLLRGYQSGGMPGNVIARELIPLGGGIGGNNATICLACSSAILSFLSS